LSHSLYFRIKGSAFIKTSSTLIESNRPLITFPLELRIISSPFYSELIRYPLLMAPAQRIYTGCERRKIEITGIPTAAPDEQAGIVRNKHSAKA